jgi:hypothetical protein
MWRLRFRDTRLKKYRGLSLNIIGEDLSVEEAGMNRTIHILKGMPI